MDNAIKITLGGDVNFSKHYGEIASFIRRKKPPFYKRVYNKLTKKFHKGSFHPNDAAALEIKKIHLEEYDEKWVDPERHVFYDQGDPFRHIGNFFLASDLGFVNLETPLSSVGRQIGAFRSSPDYAAILKNNNIKIVSVANNHAFDAGELGFEETLHNLANNSISYCGGGRNLVEIRRGVILDVKGLKVGFLAYSNLCNSYFMSLATNKQSGIAPLHEKIVLQDIRCLRGKTDFLIVAPHFDIENSSRISKYAINIAHKMVEAGASLIIGSHSHVPKPIQVYKGKLIIYSLGNLIFTYSKSSWGNNLIAEIFLSKAGVYSKARFSEVDSRGANVFVPKISQHGHSALMSELQRQSALLFNTRLAFENSSLVLDFCKK